MASMDRLTRSRSRLTAAGLVVAGALAALPAPAHAASTTPDLRAATRYLVTSDTADGVSEGTTLKHDGYYESGPRFADFGLTMDGAYALAAAHARTPVLQKVVSFIQSGTDGSGNTIRDYTETGPAEEVDGGYPYISSGGLGKEALLAEMVGDDPTSFGGQNLIALIDGTVCTTKTDQPSFCAGKGAYENAYSTFSQALALMAQLRAGDAANAAAPIAYLERQQQSSGAWSSCQPACDSDVDSTAMAVMALALSRTVPARAAAQRAINWIAAQQESDGGFPGASGDSTNTTALALMALHLATPRTEYAAQIADGLTFLAGEQNADGGFDIATGQTGSDVRASTQAVSGIVGTSFGTVSDPLTAVTAAPAG
jgi:hypothetical protein